MEFNPFDMFADGHPFPHRRTQNRSPYNNFPNNAKPQMHDNDRWDWPFTVAGRGPPNDPEKNANPRRDCSSHGAAHSPSKPNRKGRVFSVPVYDGTQSPSAPPKATAAPKMDRAVAAVKIQSTFRGFCVRNSRPLEKLRIIGRVKLDADKIECSLTDGRQAQRIRENEEECVKLDNQITSLLLRLDAIQGVNSFVRDSRKAVNRQVFKLQEAVDALISGKTKEGEGQIGYGHSHDGMESQSQMHEHHAAGEAVAVAEAENERLEMMVSDLWTQIHSRDEIINDLSFRVAQLELQLSEEKEEEE